MRTSVRPYRRHPVRRFFKWLFLILLFVGVIAAAGILFYVRNVIVNAPELDLNLVIPSSAATYIYDENGKRVQKLTLPESDRDLVSIDRIPDNLQHAFVAIEDSRFYQHHGIDPKGIIRAFFMGLRGGRFSEGASTITQQLLKNSIFTDWTKESSFDDRLRRKIQEQYLATKLEKLLTKEQILEDYLNVINLGAGCYGVQSAAYRYFGKDVSDLSLAECAVIAAITQNPSRYNPLTDPEANKTRAKAVLDRMLTQGYITQTDYMAAQLEDVYSHLQSNETRAEEFSSVYTYYQDALIDQVMNDLMEIKGYTRQQAYRSLYTGGLKIYSAQDNAIQEICDQVFADPSNFPEETRAGIDYALSVQHDDGEIIHYGNESLRKYIRAQEDPGFNLMFDTEEQAVSAAERFREATLQEGDTVLGERVTVTMQPQASVVVIDQSTGLVKAVVGGRGAKEASLTLNRATYTTRQPGSTFKIITTYAPALDTGGKTLATVYDSSPYTFNDGTTVKNWDLDQTSGNVSIREAIVRSVNTAAVRCIMDITPIVGFTCARSFGISSLVDRDPTGQTNLTDVIPSLALGGITNGVTTLELGAAYAAIANAGTYITPKFYTKVTNPYGEILLDASGQEKHAVIKPQTAYLLTDAMRGVISDPQGTAYGSVDLHGMDAAGKTGTTSSYRDLWFAGYTPYYTCCVWGGYDNNEVLQEEGIGHTYQKQLWNAIMQRIHEALPAREFETPGGIRKIRICRETGEAASPGCSDVKEELFEEASLPSVYCHIHGDGSSYGNQNGSGADAGALPSNGNTASDGQLFIGSEAGNNMPQQNGGTVDVSDGTAWDSGDGWITFYDTSGTPDQQTPDDSAYDPGMNIQFPEEAPQIPDAPAQVPEEAPQAPDWSLPDSNPAASNPITIYSSDEAVLLPDQNNMYYEDAVNDMHDPNAVAAG